jgi:hypothetical protein
MHTLFGYPNDGSRNGQPCEPYEPTRAVLPASIQFLENFLQHAAFSDYHFQAKIWKDNLIPFVVGDLIPSSLDIVTTTPELNRIVKATPKSLTRDLQVLCLPILFPNIDLKNTSSFPAIMDSFRSYTVTQQTAMAVFFNSLDKQGSSEYANLLKKCEKNPKLHIIKPVNEYLQMKSRTVEQVAERIVSNRAEKKRKDEAKEEDDRKKSQIALDELTEVNRLRPIKSACTDIKTTVEIFISKVSRTASPTACNSSLLEEEGRVLFTSCCAQQTLLSHAENASGCVDNLAEMTISIKSIVGVCASANWAKNYKQSISSSGPSISSAAVQLDIGHYSTTSKRKRGAQRKFEKIGEDTPEFIPQKRFSVATSNVRRKMVS